MRRTLATAAPDIEFRVWPDTGDRRDIAYAAVWNPPAELFQSLPALEAVFALSAGVDRLLENPALPASVPLIRLEDAGMADFMAEYVMYGVLHAHRRMPTFAVAAQAREWAHNVSVPVAASCRVGILGAGVLGQHVAKRLVLNGYPVQCWSRGPRSLPPGVSSVHGADALLTMAASSDVLVCLLPLTDSTRGILDRRLFEAMPKDGFVINAARGAHLVDEDLLAAVQSGHLSGALLDVMHEEPASASHPFWDEPRIVTTPHIAAPSPPLASAEQACAALVALRRGDTPPGLVDRASGY